MSSEVFSRVPSVFFVCAGTSNAGGGCTLQYVLDNGGFAGFDKSKIMDGSGEYIAFSEGATYENATGIVTENSPGDFDDAEVGMIVNISDGGSGLDNPGRYEITAVGATTITIESGLHSGDTDLEVYVGGSFGTLADALDNITAEDAGGHHDCYLFTNTNEQVFARPEVSGGGSIANNTKLFITGFNTALLDMMPGGAYYQSASDAWYLGIDADCHVEIDLGSNYDFLFSANCIIMHNIYVKDATTATLNFATGSSGIVLFNCIVSGSVRTIYASADNRAICFVDCYIFDGSTNLIKQNGDESNMYFIDCVLDQEENDATMIYGASADSTIVLSGCLITNGKYLFIVSSHFVEWNNTIIGHADNLESIHRVNDAAGIRISFNDIIVMRDDAELVDIVSGGGCVLADRHCIWGNSGAYGGNYGVTAKSGGSAGRRDFNTIDVDPELNSSYRPRNPQVLRGGTAMLSDGRSQLGAIKQKYQFPQKGRTVNHGRLGILK